MQPLLTHCSIAFGQHGSLFLAFFLAGLVGGFTHCISMCGMFSACGNLCAGKCQSDIRTLKGVWESLNISYHLGRGSTYGLLGGIAALAGKQIAATAAWPWISSVMLIAAGATFLVSSFSASAPHGTHHMLLSRFAPVLKGQSFLQGVLLGFMPCGLSYAAVMMAATLANPIYGMAAMWLFTLGTLPALFLANLTAAYAARRWQNAMWRMGRVMMAFNGLLLLATAGKLMG